MFASYLLLVMCFFIAVSTDTTDFILNSMRIKLDEECIDQNIGSKTYTDMKDGDLKNCIPDVEQTISGRVINSDSESIGDVVTEFCGNEGPVLCNDIVEEKLNACLSDLQRDHLNYTKKAGLDILEYVCENDGKVIRELNEMDMAACDQDAKTAKHEECRRYLPNEVPVKLENLYRDTCANFKKYIQCSPNVFKSCPNKAMYNYVSETGKRILKAMPCGCNPTSTLSLLLIFTVLSVAFVQNYVF